MDQLVREAVGLLPCVFVPVAIWQNSRCLLYYRSLRTDIVWHNRTLMNRQHDLLGSSQLKRVAARQRLELAVVLGNSSAPGSGQCQPFRAGQVHP